MRRKDAQALVQEIEKTGAVVILSRRNHFKVYRDDRLVVTFSGTPSDWRSQRNLRADLRKLGLMI